MEPEDRVAYPIIAGHRGGEGSLRGPCHNFLKPGPILFCPPKNEVCSLIYSLDPNQMDGES